MNESERIADQHLRALKGPAWHGDSVMEILDGVTAGEAAAKPIPGAHSIWELLLHLEAWNRMAIEALDGPEYEVPEALNFPSVVDSGEQAWHDTLTRLATTKELLVTRIRALPLARLDETVPGQKYSRHFLLHGVVQHDLYHAGQMAVLKKAVRARQPE